MRLAGVEISANISAALLFPAVQTVKGVCEQWHRLAVEVDKLIHVEVSNLCSSFVFFERSVQRMQRLIVMERNNK